MQIERIPTGTLHRRSLEDSPRAAKPLSSDWSARARTLAGVSMLCLSTVLGACSGSGSGSEPGEMPGSESDPIVAPGKTPDSLLQLEDDPGFLSSIPDVVSSVIRADTGLQIAYTRKDQEIAVPGALVEQQWVYMQTCIGQQSSPPLVVIRDGAVMPFTQTDDVIFNIDGIPVASASLRVVSVIQVQEADFDGSLGNPGFNLRSIMGRLLWLSANLPERDYPFNCALQQPE